MSTPPLSAMRALEVLAGARDVESFESALACEDIRNEQVATEMWRVVGLKSLSEGRVRAAELAHARRSLHAERIFSLATALPVVTAQETLDKLKAYAAKCAFQTHGDTYVALVLKAMLPPAETALVPRGQAPYEAAARVWGADTNRHIRPLLTTPICDVLRTATWAPSDLRGLFAGVVTLKEMTGGEPAVYIDAEIAAADPATPSLAVCRKHLLGGGVGILHKHAFIKCCGPLEALHILWSRLITS